MIFTQETIETYCKELAEDRKSWNHPLADEIVQKAQTVLREYIGKPADQKNTSIIEDRINELLESYQKEKPITVLHGVAA